jgi:hypothetical protein
MQQGNISVYARVGRYKSIIFMLPFPYSLEILPGRWSTRNGEKQKLLKDKFCLPVRNQSFRWLTSQDSIVSY